jgi:hypothetical protein
VQRKDGSKEMSIYKSVGDQEIQEDDPIERIKNLRSARVKKIERRMHILIGIAFGGVPLMAVLNGMGVIVFSKTYFPDNSFAQRVCGVWFDLLIATLPIGMLAALRAKLSDFISEKAGTPCILIGVIGFGILIYTAAEFFSRPYTGANMPVNWHFVGGWFLVFWGIVFRK